MPTLPTLPALPETVSLEMLTKVFALAQVGIVVVDQDKNIRLCNDYACQILGYAQDELSHMRLPEVIHPDHVLESAVNFARLISAQAVSTQSTRRFLHRNGDTVWGQLNATPIEYLGEPAVLAVITDLTAIKTAEEALRVHAAVFEYAQEGIMVCDAQNEVIAVNAAFSRITGYSLQEMREGSTRQLKSGRHDAAFYQALWDALLSVGFWEGELWNRRKNGEVYPEWLSITAIRDTDGQIVRYMAIFTDISQRKANQARTEYLAHFDPLTDLPNRALLNDRLTQGIQYAERTQSTLAVLFLDLDHFKLVNDTFGHVVGDDLLKQVADRLRDTVRQQDTVSRLGGDEFVLLLPDASADGALAVAEKLLAVVGEPYFIAGHSLSVSVSVGISLYPEHGNTNQILLERADQAMYLAKKSGRNACQLFFAHGV